MQCLLVSPRFPYTPMMLVEEIILRVETHSNCGQDLIGERAKRARYYQGCTNSSLCGIYVYIYIYMYGGTYAILVAHATHT